MDLLTACKMANLAYKGYNKKTNKTYNEILLNITRIVKDI